MSLFIVETTLDRIAAEAGMVTAGPGAVFPPRLRQTAMMGRLLSLNP